MTRVGPSVADSQRPAGTEMVQELEGAWALVYTERLESILGAKSLQRRSTEQC